MHNSGICPELVNGATLDYLTPQEIAKIQRYADETGATVTVFGSRVTGTGYVSGKPLTANSDFDYIISGTNSRGRAKAKDPRSGISLPRGGGGGEIGAGGMETGIDIWTPENFSANGYTLADRPHIIFAPRQK